MSETTSDSGPLPGLRVQQTTGVAPTVVFSNGLGETLDFWYMVVPRLVGMATFAFDRPAVPDSTAAPSLTGGVAEMAAITASIEGPMILVAHSYGGAIAEAFARVHPDRVAAMVLVDTTIPEEYADDSADADKPGRFGSIRKSIDRALVSDAARPVLKFALPKAMVGLGTNTGSTKNILAGFPAEFADRLTEPGHLARTIFENKYSGKYCRQLIELRAAAPFPDIPVRVLVGGRGSRVWRRTETDWIVAQREQLSEFGDDVSMQVLEGAHLLMLDCPEDVADAICQVHDLATQQSETSETNDQSIQGDN